MKKKRDLLIIAGIYLLAYGIGFISCFRIPNQLLKFFVFDTVATVVTFVFSSVLKNSSVYDAYWSLTPMVISIWLFVLNRSFSVYQILFLVVFNLWSLRLTINWIEVFTDFSYEDWRYRKFRKETSKWFWPAVNFFGIHYMPTLIVFAAMLPLFVLSENKLGFLSIPGFLIMLCGIAFEFFADRNMHSFLEKKKSSEVCREGLWNYSRHPNYLGEILFWLGTYLSMLPYAWNYWYYGAGFVAVAVMFNVISIPLMEKRQISKRSGYKEYCLQTSRLLLLPKLK